MASLSNTFPHLVRPPDLPELLLCGVLQDVVEVLDERVDASVLLLGVLGQGVDHKARTQACKRTFIPK